MYIYTYACVRVACVLCLVICRLCDRSEACRGICLELYGSTEVEELMQSTDRYRTPQPLEVKMTWASDVVNKEFKAFRTKYSQLCFEHCKPDGFQSALSLINEKDNQGFAYSG